MTSSGWIVSCGAVLVAGVASVASGIEQPEYDVMVADGQVELRRYAPYLVAETVVEGGFTDAGGEAFGILFDYISGDNSGDTRIDMTAPVVQEAVRSVGSQEVAVSERGPDGAWRVGFVVPSAFDASTVPKPTDPRVAVREVPERLVVAVRFSGRWTDERFAEHEDLATRWCEARGYEVSGPAVRARYNPPFTPWFMRRNEILLPVRDTSEPRRP